jgi:riboflavin synthase
MFTGLIQDVGTVESLDSGADGATLRIATSLGSEIAAGDSVAVNGACLTATEPGGRGFAAEAMNQTLRLTALGDLEAGSRVNLELALRASDRLGGHILQGHVDGIGEVVAVEEDGFARRLRIGLGPDLLRYVVERGSIALDGVSLTVAVLDDRSATASLIPETLERTTLGALEPGCKVNVECDVVAKYVERLVSPFAERSGREPNDRNAEDRT